MVEKNKPRIKPIVIADKITKLYPVYNKRKRKRGESIFTYFKKDLGFENKKNLFKALDEVSFNIYPGESVGIVGRNGSGKSTLLRVLTGISHATSGSAIVKGTYGELFSISGGLDSDLTGRQNIYLYSAIKGIPKDKTDKLVPEIIEFSELIDFIDQPVKTYSNGMKGRLGFSLVTAVLPKVMFIDEALGAGDSRFRLKCDERFEEYLSDKTKTIVIVSHSMAYLRNLCSRVIWLDSGVIKEDGEPNQVIDHYMEYLSKMPDSSGKKAKNRKKLVQKFEANPDMI